MVKESAQYDNYLDKEGRIKDEYKATLDKFTEDGEEFASVLPEIPKSDAELEGNYKHLIVHIQDLDSFKDLCEKLGQYIDTKQTSTYFPLADPNTNFFGDTYEQPITIADTSRMVAKPKRQPQPRTDLSRENRYSLHWQNMPSFNQPQIESYRSITIKIRTEEAYKELQNRLGESYNDKTKAIWHPRKVFPKNFNLRWIQPDRHDLPKYPMYIVSKTRYDSMITSKSFNRMKIPHYIVIEPQEKELYEKALEKFGLTYAELLVAPFSNHGDGPGRARNWAWDHSIELGATSHWVFDDNIADFYRLHNNQRIRFESGVGFKAMEDFVDRYENIPVAGPQYRFFVPSDLYRPPYVANTRIYSALLIRNDCKHRWRGRYNEDTDLCLRVLKDGDCTVQFNAFLQGKTATQTVAGGNTAEFYHAENSDKINKEGYNTDGTINKSQMLADMHPDVARVVWKYGRWHHFVDYEPFKSNRLIFKEGIEIPEGNNDYGMELITDYTEST
jgi:hypothetical protein